VLNSWLTTRSYIVGYVIIFLKENFPSLFLSWVVEAVCISAPSHASSFQFHDEQHWSVLLSGLKNRQMTITKAFKCTSEFSLKIFTSHGRSFEFAKLTSRKILPNPSRCRLLQGPLLLPRRHKIPLCRKMVQAYCFLLR
jgi:hypothetical protein